MLYVAHKEELDVMVAGFQQRVSDYLAPLSVRDRVRDAAEEKFRQDVVNAWFSWLQELYCDAVGVTIGGPCYVQAFSHVFRTRSEEQYYLPRSKQITRTHPVTWLRAKILAGRARKLGLIVLADQTEDTWQQIAETMAIAEDYEGTWAEELFVPLRAVLDKMLEESRPREYADNDMAGSSGAECESPVRLPNVAWGRFEGARNSYHQWEETKIQEFLEAH